MSENESVELARRLADGDRSALDALLRRHLPGLRGYVRLHGGEFLRAREASVDLVQSVCREVLEHADNFRHPSEGAFRRWLFTTALRKIRHRYEYWGAQKRDAGREVPGGGESGAGLVECYASFVTPSRDLEAREEVERIERAFDRLSERHREVIVLARVVGLSRREIGERMGSSEVAVRTLLSRAQARLAELLDEAD